jgi:hypothetical protein
MTEEKQPAPRDPWREAVELAKQLERKMPKREAD